MTGDTERNLIDIQVTEYLYAEHYQGCGVIREDWRLLEEDSMTATGAPPQRLRVVSIIIGGETDES